MRISDWSSDVCSSDLPEPVGAFHQGQRFADHIAGGRVAAGLDRGPDHRREIRRQRYRNVRWLHPVADVRLSAVNMSPVRPDRQPGPACSSPRRRLSYPVLQHGCRAMPSAERAITTVSTKGQVILPKAIRERLHWKAGTRLVIESTPDGVSLKAAALFPRTEVDAVFGSLAFDGPAKSIEEMDAAVVAEARRRARD